MVKTSSSRSEIPVITADPFSPENLTAPRSLHEQLREAGSVVYLERYGVWAMARYEQVYTALKNWATFSSASGVGLSNYRKEKPWRIPSILQEADPPAHTRAREIVNPILSPPALKALRMSLEREATILVEQLVTQGSFDVVSQLAQAYLVKVFGDAVGLPEEGREKLLAYSKMANNAFGPHNHLFESSMAGAQEVKQWITTCCSREALRPTGFGAQIWEAAEKGLIPEEWAPLLVRSLFTAGIDSTANGIAAVVCGFAKHPDQWKLLREEPSLATSAFEEALRWESPVHGFYRTTTCEVEFVEGSVPKGEKVLLFFGAANRDPRRWTNPDQFDIRRNSLGHVGFGMGIHRCVGLSLARMGAEILLTALARRVERIEIISQPQRLPNNTLHAWESLPVAIHTSSL